MTQDDFAPIAALDLDPIKVKLMHAESSEGWSREKADAIEFEYRRFLYLMKKFPTEQTAPLFDVDIFWHYHILDTMKYMEDCEAVFGYYLHHFPYVGLRGEDDEAAHHRVGERMKTLYEETFGEPYVRDGGAAQGAWSSVAPSAADATGWPGVEAIRAAWSSAPGARTAWSSAPSAKTAWSSVAPPAKTAWSSVAPPARTAWSSVAPPAKTAWSSVAPSAPSVKAAWSSAPSAKGDDFYSARPTLAPAA